MQNELKKLHTYFLGIASNIEHAKVTVAEHLPKTEILILSKIGIAETAINDVLAEVTNSLHGLKLAEQAAIQEAEARAAFYCLEAEPRDIDAEYYIDFESVHNDASKHIDALRDSIALVFDLLPAAESLDHLQGVL